MLSRNVTAICSHAASCLTCRTTSWDQHPVSWWTFTISHHLSRIVSSHGTSIRFGTRYVLDSTTLILRKLGPCMSTAASEMQSHKYLESMQLKLTSHAAAHTVSTDNAVPVWSHLAHASWVAAVVVQLLQVWLSLQHNHSLFFSVHRLLAFARSINTLLHVAGQLKQLVIMFILETRVNQEFGAGEGPDTQSKDSCSKTFLPTRCWFGACLHWNSAAEEGAWVG